MENTLKFVYDYPSTGSDEYRLLRFGLRSKIASFGQALGNPLVTQKKRLDLILRNGRNSEFGIQHSLKKVKSLEEYRQAVPIYCYDDLLPFLQKTFVGQANILTKERIISFMETSGTSGKPKHIPVTKSWRTSIAIAQRLWILSMMRDFPQIGKGKALTMVSPAIHGETEGGIPIGSNTGRMMKEQPWWIRNNYPIPYEVFLIQDIEVMQYTYLRFALQENITSWTTANPSMILLLCRRLIEWQEFLAKDLFDGTIQNGPGANLSTNQRMQFSTRLKKTCVPIDWRPGRIWPLSLVACWKGGPASFFVEQLSTALGGEIPIWEVGVTASEGYFALPLGQDWAGGVLWTLGHVMEFIDDAGEVYWLWELEVGKRYRLIITTEAGLYRYDLNDYIEVIGFCKETPVVRFVGKAGRFLNAVGEKVSEEQVSLAIRQTCLRLQFSPVGFTARLVWGQIPYIEIAVEGDPPTHFASVFDEELRKKNIEYASKRKSDRLGSPRTRSVSNGIYLRFRNMKIANGAPLGQVKDPIIALNEREWQELIDLE